MRHWGDHRLLLEAREGAWWDASKIGLGPPPLETSEGWLMMYHGVHVTAAGAIYRSGLALLDLEDPSVVLHRSDDWVLSPTAPYERAGDVSDVVFPCGWLLDEGTRPAARLLRRRGHLGRRGHRPASASCSSTCWRARHRSQRPPSDRLVAAARRPIGPRMRSTATSQASVDSAPWLRVQAAPARGRRGRHPRPGSATGRPRSLAPVNQA